ncbi:hypothetical protein P175DRAFT_0557292 [Aspergillus ochraceoroseus IBT 24754]|uniref:Uncharacterized protein n=1 Tax=Aspergillus ochraceoroseus IBT 24754 TaxID=1392256 RepID=A0A2T5LWF4_9EURO|nr:uncharacterized protein P175DRAFT_0557292 [Aspergillus ochraceoroseus IBT 24754]PTU20607.1 hypothetical protein P175DRAFT_0557292 [Aspergillus ochraceoroseus IBT 24754]
MNLTKSSGGVRMVDGKRMKCGWLDYNDFVQIHLSDAQMWTKFTELHTAQMRYLRSLSDSYDRWPMLQEGAVAWISWKRENLQSEVDGADTRITERIAHLTKVSQKLIVTAGLAILTSIAEAQKSTSTYRSLKRLSWITVSSINR